MAPWSDLWLMALSCHIFGRIVYNSNEVSVNEIFNPIISSICVRTVIVIPSLSTCMWVFSRYPRPRCNFFQSSWVGCEPLFNSNEIVVARVDRFLILATVEWKINCRGPGSSRKTVTSSALFKPRSHTAFSKTLFKPQHFLGGGEINLKPQLPRFFKYTVQTTSFFRGKNDFKQHFLRFFNEIRAQNTVF